MEYVLSKDVVSSYFQVQIILFINYSLLSYTVLRLYKNIVYAYLYFWNMFSAEKL